jgi:hypothetical protein
MRAPRAVTTLDVRKRRIKAALGAIRASEDGAAYMPTYREIKSRNSVTRDYGGRVEVETKIPPNTCHPREIIQWHSLAKPPIWTCACGKTLLVETVVNDAIISEREAAFT